MAQTGRYDRNIGDYCHLGVSGGQRILIYRPAAYIVAGSYISNCRHNLDRAIASAAHLDGNGIVQSAT